MERKPAVEFVCILVFQALYFLRPQDWIPAIAGAPFVSIIMLVAIIALFTRPGGVTVRTFFRTPHDWLMFLYFGWVIYSADAPFSMFKTLVPFIAFYVITLQALNTVDRLEKFLRWWCALLVILSVVGILTSFGLDITGAAEKIVLNQGRLCLNTYMHNNPNALGHSVVIAVPMALMLYVWRSDLSFLKGLGFAFIAGYCAYLTESKGSFIVGFVVLVLALLFGLPRVFQLILASLAALGGSALLSVLPRMGELSKSEQGIQGRVLAWNSALESLRLYPEGVGWKNFAARFMWEGELVIKATHSSYVQIGAALGFIGLFCYMGVVYGWFRTILLARPANLREDRIRRVLLIVAAAFALSNWMIDRAYHTEFFLLSAAVAAYHRLVVLRKWDFETEDDQDERVGAQPVIVLVGASPALPAATIPQLSLSSGLLLPQTSRGFLQPGADAHAPAADSKPAASLAERFLRWERLQLIDLPFIYFLYWAVLEIWTYVVTHF
jgi:O-antigen ligase